jgi:hypothetical protein
VLPNRPMPLDGARVMHMREGAEHSDRAKPLSVPYSGDWLALSPILLPDPFRYLNSRCGSQSDSPGQNVTTTRNAIIVRSHGPTATVNSVMPILVIPDAT